MSSYGEVPKGYWMDESNPELLVLRRKKDGISLASGVHTSALAMGVTPFAGMVRSVVGFAAKLGLILAEVCLMVLSLLLFDVVMAVLV